jgi:hypothetical protein
VYQLTLVGAMPRVVSCLTVVLGPILVLFVSSLGLPAVHRQRPRGRPRGVQRYKRGRCLRALALG